MGYPTKRQLVPNSTRAGFINKGLLCCYQLGEAGSQIITDCSGSNRHMAVGATATTPAWVGGQYGAALQWANNIGERYECSEDHARFGSRGTVYFRAKAIAPVTVTGDIAVSIGGAVSGASFDGFLWIVLYTASVNRMQFGYRSDGESSTTVGFVTDTTNAFEDQVWTDFFITGDGTSYAAYSNDVQLSVAALGGGAYKWLGDIVLTEPVKRGIGMRYRGGAWALSGEFDLAELRIYDRVLTTKEMGDIRKGLG